MTSRSSMLIGVLAGLMAALVLSAAASASAVRHDIFQSAAEGRLDSAPVTLNGQIATTPAGHVLTAAQIRSAARRGHARARVAETFKCSEQGFWYSTYNNRFISTELGYSGAEYAMLRARAETVGPWELYQLCKSNETGLWSIWSNAALRWVTAEIGDPGEMYGMLAAQGTGVSHWERFTGPEPANDKCDLKSNENGLWVSAEFGYTGNWYGMLRARSSTVGEWEKFECYFPPEQ